MSVKLTVQDNLLFIEPWVDHLWPALHYKKQGKSTKWPFKFISTDEYVYTTEEADGKTIGLTYSGMLNAVVEKLKDLKVDYDIVDHRPAPQAADEDYIQGLRTFQDKILEVLLYHHIGIIEAPPGLGKTHCMCQAARALPTTNILVTTPRSDVVTDIYDRISDSLSDIPIRTASLMKGGKKFNKAMDRSNVIVCTAQSLHKIPSDWPDLIIFDECHGCATKKITKVLEAFTNCRRIGLSASPDGRLDGADMEVTAQFGHKSVVIEYPEAVKEGLVVPIHAHLCAVEGQLEVNPRAQDVTKQRALYWANDLRNTKIEQVAKSIPDDEACLIMVRTVEHALRLRFHLPEYHLVHGGIQEKDWQKFVKMKLVEDTDEFRAALQECDSDLMKACFKAGTVKKVIATGKWREGVDFKSLEHLIRAEGSSGSIDSIQIVGRLSRLFPGKTVGNVYDFVDAYHPTPHNKSKKRIKCYEKQGWIIDKDYQPPAF